MPDHNKSSRSPGLLSKIKNIFGLNIGTIIFGVLLLYMIFSMIVYLASDTVESYQVISGPLSRNETYTGLAIREESIYKADSDGFITYYAREGNKINANGPVYGISSSKATENSAELTPEELTSIRNDMMSFSKGFNPSKSGGKYPSVCRNLRRRRGISGRSGGYKSRQRRNCSLFHGRLRK